MTAAELVSRTLPKARRRGKGWMAPCPAHEDRRPSLSISDGDAERDCWRAQKRKGLEPGDLPHPPVPPIERRLLVVDVTCEKLGALLQDNPQGLLLSRDELAAWIGSFDRYAAGKGSDAPAWLSFFDAAPVVIDRKTVKGTIFVERASVSVLGGIQPGILQRMFGAAERESGLLARLLLVQPPTRPALWTDQELSHATARAWSNLLKSLVEIEPAQDEQHRPCPHLIPLSAEAKPIYIAWHDAHGREVADIYADDMAAHFAKLKGICIRLALIFACVDAAGRGEAVVAINREHIERAISIVEWFKHEARRVYGALSEEDSERGRRRLVELIQRKGGTVTVRELQQGSRLYKTAGEAESALDALAEAGLGRWEQQSPGPKGGRPSRIFRLAEPQAVYTTPENSTPAPTKPPLALSQEGCVDVDTTDASDAEDGDWGQV